MPIRDKFVARTCPSCGESPNEAEYQYLAPDMILECTGCELRWTSRMGYNDHYLVYSTRKPTEKDRKQEIDSLIQRYEGFYE
jgi:hypothetical protein